MKKTSLLLFALVAFAFVANAQEFKKFRVGVGSGYAGASGKGASGGVLFYLEPSYRVADNLSVGLRAEWALVTRGFSEDPGDADFDIAAIGSYTLNGQYYFNNNKFRPFVGAGLGIYSLAAVKVDSDFGGDSEELVGTSSKFGFYPRIGFDLNHFTMSFDYNIIPATKVDGFDVETKNSYFGVRIGAFFGGGRK